MSNLTYKAVNWNTPTSELARIFWGPAMETNLVP